MFSGLPEFPLPMTLSHNLGHPAISSEFWPPNFGIHPTLLPPNPSILHQNMIPNYKIPNFHAILSQYMGLNNLGIFGYPQNLSINTRLSPQNSPKESPTARDEK